MIQAIIRMIIFYEKCPPSWQGLELPDLIPCRGVRFSKEL